MRYGIATGIRIFLDDGDAIQIVVTAIAAILLEIYLARREKWWPGLLLPAASILWAAADIVSCLAVPSEAAFGLKLGACLHLFLIQNSRPLVLLVIYAACREVWRQKRKKAGELNRTRIHDI